MKLLVQFAILIILYSCNSDDSAAPTPVIHIYTSQQSNNSSPIGSEMKQDNSSEQTISELAGEVMDEEEVLKDEGLITSNVQDITSEENFDLERALVEVDLIEFELTELGCEFDLELFFDGFIVKKYRGSFECPSRMNAKGKSDAIYYMNSYLYLANNIPTRSLDENLRHLLVVKVQELGKVNRRLIDGVNTSLASVFEKYERYSSKFKELDCVIDKNCNPTESEFESIRTIKRECSRHHEELGIYSRVWPMLQKISYSEMINFFEGCKNLELEGDGGDDKVVEDNELDPDKILDGEPLIDLEFHCYSSASSRILLYCQRIKRKIIEWTIDREFRESFLALGINEILIDESARKSMQRVRGMLITYKEYEDSQSFLSDLNKL